MALKSDRHDAKVDIKKGVYVEMEGIMEVRYTSEDQDYPPETEDMFIFQRENPNIPEDFCRKSNFAQNYFFCLVCNCDLKSIVTLGDHVTGNKHVRKACVKKREVLGLPAEPQNAPRVKKQKQQVTRAEVNLRLKDRLEESGLHVVGLSFIEEFVNPDNDKDYPMYSCKLQGCKSAWGNSDDMFRHVTKHKHQRNFFLFKFPGDDRIMKMQTNEITLKVQEYEESQGGMEGRNYDVVLLTSDRKKYREMRDRPQDWSEKKANAGIVFSQNGRSMKNGSSANYEPLGDNRRRRKSNGVRASPPRPTTTVLGWHDWQPKSHETYHQECMQKKKDHLQMLREMVEELGRSGPATPTPEDIKYFINFHKSILNMEDSSGENRDRIREHMVELQRLEKAMEEKVERMEVQERQAKQINTSLLEVQERQAKQINTSLLELEEEVKQFSDGRDTSKFQNYKARLKDLVRTVGKFSPTLEEFVKQREGFNSRIAELYQQYEERAEPLSDNPERPPTHLASQPPSSQAPVSQPPAPLPPAQEFSPSQPKEERAEATARFSDSLSEFVSQELVQRYGAKLPTESDRRPFALKILDKVLPNEVVVFGKKGFPWHQFVLDSKIRKRVSIFIDNYVKRKFSEN